MLGRWILAWGASVVPVGSRRHGERSAVITPSPLTIVTEIHRNSKNRRPATDLDQDPLGQYTDLLDWSPRYVLSSIGHDTVLSKTKTTLPFFPFVAPRLTLLLLYRSTHSAIPFPKPNDKLFPPASAYSSLPSTLENALAILRLVRRRGRCTVGPHFLTPLFCSLYSITNDREYVSLLPIPTPPDALALTHRRNHHNLDHRLFGLRHGFQTNFTFPSHPTFSIFPLSKPIITDYCRFSANHARSFESCEVVHHRLPPNCRLDFA